MSERLGGPIWTRMDIVEKLQGKEIRMAMPSKGDRGRLGRVPTAVYSDLEKLAEKAGASSVSQYVSDLLSLHTGHPELVRELDQGVLPLSA